MDVMIDLELMGDGPTGAIVSIGALPFERTGPLPSWGEAQARGFEVRVGLQSSINAGGRISGKAVEFWLRQSDEARLRLLQDTLPLKDALSATRSFLMKAAGDNHKELVVWSKPAAGDLVILAEAYRSFGKPAPWLGKNRRCLSTLKMEAGIDDWLSNEAKREHPELVHIALFDCWLQVLDARQVLEFHRPGKQAENELIGG